MRKLLILVLILCTLTGCSKAPTLPPEAAPALTVAYVPLDDRPVNDDRVAYLAASLGFDFQMPARHLYHTALDGQTPNPNGNQYGDRGALWDWVMAQDAAGCNVFVLSLDQLFSGGLVNSRVVTAPIVFPDGSVKTHQEVLEDYLLPLAQDPENQLYLIDTVMRLAPTVGYQGFGLEEYETLRTYAMTARPTLDTLSVENIIANYPYDATGALAPADSSLTDDILNHYHQARAQKLTLIDHILQQTNGFSNVEFLIGVDDSAPDDSIQTSELAYLRQAVAGRGAVLSGADEDGMLALCRVYADLVYTGEMPTVAVRYFGGSENSASSDYDHQPMTKVVAEHLDYLGVTQVSHGNHDMEILVLTAPQENASTTWSDLIIALQKNEKNSVPTVLLDAAKHAYGATFQGELIAKTQLGMLFGYGGFYDLANVTGVSVANGLARWLVLAEEGTVSQERNLNFARTLADSLIKDLCYKNDAKVSLALYVQNELGGDPNNFSTNHTDMGVILPKLEAFLQEDSKAVRKNLERSNLLVSLDGTTMGWGDVSLEHVTTPWERTFEVRFDLVLGALKNPHFRLNF